MSVRIGRTLVPAGAPIGMKNIGHGVLAMRPGSVATATLTEQVKAYFRVRYCFLLSSGKASLALILTALKELYPDRDEVLIPAFTCYSVPAAIHRLGLRIRICDIDPKTLDFDYGELAGHLTAPRLLCVIPTHLFGVTADVDRVRDLVGDRQIPVIEDAAQTMGGELRGRKAGTLGDAGFFSLERGKAFSTVRGGMIVTDSIAIGEALARHVAAVPATGPAEQATLAAYALAIVIFSRPWLYWLPRSLPFLGLGETVFAPDFPIRRLSAFQAGLAAGWPERLGEHIRLRKKNAQLLHQLGVAAQCSPEARGSGLLRYPVLTGSRAEKAAFLIRSERLGLGAADVYPGTVADIPALKGVIVDGRSGGAVSLVARMVTLPVHPSVRRADLVRLAGLLGQPVRLAPAKNTLHHEGGRLR